VKSEDRLLLFSLLISHFSFERWIFFRKSFKINLEMKMKREITPPSKRLLIFYRVVVAVILALVLVLVMGSLYAILRPPDSGPLFSIGGKGGGGAAPRNGRASNPGQETAVFADIGRLRIPVTSGARTEAAGTEAPASATLILSVSFPYPANDRSFAEELGSRTDEFRSLAIDYFSGQPAENIARMDEETAKAEILQRFNSLLRLGKIETLYFSDFMLVE
jgi:flagellar basal body-associated protein FliL